MHRHRCRLAAGKRHRENRLVARRPRRIVHKPEPAAERVGKKGMAYDRFRHLPLGKAGNSDFVGVEERKLQPAVGQDSIALVGLERVCRLAKTPLEKLERKVARHIRRKTFVDKVVHRLRCRRELAGALVAFVEGERRKNRGENLPKAALSELHLHKLENRAQRMLRLRRNVVDLRGDELLLAVVEVDESRGELRIVDLQFRLEPAPDIAAAHKRGEDGIRGRSRKRGKLMGEVSERRGGKRHRRRIVHLQPLCAERALYLGKSLGICEAKRGKRLVRLY